MYYIWYTHFGDQSHHHVVKIYIWQYIYGQTSTFAIFYLPMSLLAVFICKVLCNVYFDRYCINKVFISSYYMKYFCRQMKVAWRKVIIPKAWRRTGGIWFPRRRTPQPSASSTKQSVVFLKKIPCQHLRTEGQGKWFFSGCLEHSSCVHIIWYQIQMAKKEKKNLPMIFLDLVNAFRSVPHKILWTSFVFFHIPEAITKLVKACIQYLQFCVTAQDSTIAWQYLKIGIMVGCIISPLALAMAMEIMSQASWWVVGDKRLENGLRFPPNQGIYGWRDNDNNKDMH